MVPAPMNQPLPALMGAMVAAAEAEAVVVVVVEAAM